MSNGYYRRGGLMGPAILITIGSLFLIERWMPEYGFHELWPVILIVIGLVKLLDGSRRDCAPTPAPGAGTSGSSGATPPASGVSGPGSSGGSSNT